MSTDVIADALIPTCESSIKSLSQFLTTLHSIDALHRLKEKAEIIEAFRVITSFAPFLEPPPPAPATSTTIDHDGSSVNAKVERFERTAETSSRDRLAVAGGRQDERTALAHTPVLVHPSMLEDGRDIDDGPPPSSRSLLIQHAPPTYLIHPTRQSELSSFPPKEPPLYSFLIHFPIYHVFRAKLSIVDRLKLFSLPVMQKWRLDDAMTAHAYPRLRLTNESNACIVMDNDFGRLEAIRKDFQKAEREILAKAAADEAVLDRTFFLVGTWSEELVTLVFSTVCVVEERGSLGSVFKRWTTTPGGLWKDILGYHPILSLYHAEGEGSPLLGAGLFYQKKHDIYRRQDDHRLTLVAPFHGCPHAHLFAHDFAAQYPTVYLTVSGKRYNVGVKVVKMRPPPLKEDRSWDGPVLRHGLWLDKNDSSFCG